MQKKTGILMGLALSAVTMATLVASDADARGAVRCNNRACNTVGGITVSLEAFSGPLRWGSKVVVMKRKRKRKNVEVTLTNHYYVDGKYVGCDDTSSKGKRGTRLIMWPEVDFQVGANITYADSSNSWSVAPDGKILGIKGKSIDGVLAVATVQKGSAKESWSRRSGKIPTIGLDQLRKKDIKWERYQCSKLGSTQRERLRAR